MATRTSTSSRKRFLVAEASACSRAPKTTFLSTFFSRPSASTNKRISRLIRFLQISDVGDEARRFNVGEIERQDLPVHLEPDLACARFPQHPRKITLPLHRHAQLQARLLAGETHEIPFLPERSVEP